MNFKVRRRAVVAAVSVLVAFLASPVSPYSMGAPPSAACGDGVPRHGPQPQKAPAPFRISVAADQVDSGEMVSVQLSASDPSEPFIGFLLQAKNSSSGALSGQFHRENANDDHLFLNCDDLEDAVTHSNKKEKQRVSVRWKAPAGSSGEVSFRATFVKNKDTFWVGVESPKIVVKRSLIVQAPQETTAETPKKEPGRNPGRKFPAGDEQTTAKPSPPESNKRPPAVTRLTDENETAIYEGCGSAKGCFGSPEGCTGKRNCEKLVTYTTTPDGAGYRFELQGSVSDLANGDAYIGVAFSADDAMKDDAVVSCFTQDDVVKPMRSYNLPSVKTNRIVPPEQQKGLSNFFGSVRDLIISCSFDLEPEFTHSHGNESSTFNLAATNYHLFLASGYLKSPTQVGYHTSGTAKTQQATALASTLIQAADNMLFVRLHGAFMFGAWIGTASLGMLFARYYKTTWTGSQCFKKDLWFRFHQTFMITTWGLTMAAFVLIFLELEGWTSVKITTNPHAVLGCVTTGLCFFQPLGALFRPAPDAKSRPVFNWMHWFGGNAAQIVGIVAMFFAVDLQKAKLPKKPTYWILVAFVAFHGFIHFLLSIMQCVSDNKQRENRADVYPMKEMGVGQSYYYPQTKQDAPGGGLRKFLLAFYAIVNVAFTAVLVLMVIFAPIEKALEEWGLPVVA